MLLLLLLLLDTSFFLLFHLQWDYSFMIVPMACNAFRIRYSHGWHNFKTWKQHELCFLFAIIIDLLKCKLSDLVWVTTNIRYWYISSIDPIINNKIILHMLRERERERLSSVVVLFITSKKTHRYQSESKLLQYFGIVKYNLAILNAFAEVIKVMNHTRLWDAKFALFSPSVTCQIYLYV